MSRSRNIKPGFFKNEILAEIPFEHRLLFIGIWTEADREGRLEYRPKRLKVTLFPYDDVNVDDGVATLSENGFLTVYQVNDVTYLQVHNWTKHQNPHHKEVGSVIPAPTGHIDTVCAGYIPLSDSIRRRIYARDGRICRACGATHGLSIDHIIPVSKGGNSVDDNLQVLCLHCNASKGNRTQSMHDASMNHAQVNQDASCPTDSLNLIPDSPNLIPEQALAQPAVSPNAGFDTFWQHYPRKQGKSNAQKAWNKQKLDAQLDTILRHVELMRCEDVGWRDPQFIPHASTYLNQQRWQDEPQRGNPNARHQQNRKLSAVEQVQQSIRDAELRERGYGDTAVIEGSAYRVDSHG